jgi:hypothetical protein
MSWASFSVTFSQTHLVTLRVEPTALSTSKPKTQTQFLLKALIHSIFSSPKNVSITGSAFLQHPVTFSFSFALKNSLNHTVM